MKIGKANSNFSFVKHFFQLQILCPLNSVTPVCCHLILATLPTDELNFWKGSLQIYASGGILNSTMKSKHVSTYDPSKITLSPEMQQMFNETSTITGRPPTPDLTDDTIPCINSVKFLISQCKGFEAPDTKTSVSDLELLIENPTPSIPLVRHSLSQLQQQAGVPEYDLLLAPNSKSKLENEYNVAFAQMEAERASKMKNGRPPLYESKAAAALYPTNTNTNSSNSYSNPTIIMAKATDADDYSLAGSDTDNISVTSISNSNSNSSVQWKNGYHYHSLNSVASPKVKVSVSESNHNREDRNSVGAESLSQFSLDASLDNYGSEFSLNSATSNLRRSSSSGSTATATSGYLKQKRQKPRVFANTRRRKGPFSLVGPSNVKTTLVSE